MIFLRSDGQREPDRSPNLVANNKFLFDANELLRKSAIAVTDSKSTTDQFSIPHQWKLRPHPQLCKKIARPTVRIPRA